jgi:hypothetical protein
MKTFVCGRKKSERRSEAISLATRVPAQHQHPPIRPLVILSLSCAAYSLEGFPRNFLSSQVTEDSHRTFRRVWPRFQPKFYPRCGHVPAKKDGKVEKTRTRTLSGVKGRATWCCRPRRRTGKSVRFRLRSVPSLFSHQLSLPRSFKGGDSGERNIKRGYCTR